MPAGPVGPRTKGGVSSRSLREQAILGRHLHADLYQAKYFDGVWPSHQPILHSGNGYGAPTGTDTDENIALLPGPFPLSLLYYVNGAATILGPVQDSVNGWLEIGLDSAAGEGVEYVLGGSNDAGNPLASVVGTDPAMMIRAVLQPEDVSDIAEMAVGFRKAEAFQAAIDDYDEMACLNVQWDTDAAYVRIETILNGAGTVTVETGESTAVDATDFELEVWLMGQSLRFFVDGTQYKSTFEFDEDEVVIPFIHWLQVTGGSELRLKELQVGPLWHLNKDINRR